MLLFQADSDFFVLAELLKDYIGLIQAVKVGESDVMLKYVPFSFFSYNVYSFNKKSL